ncbi:SCP-like protein [Dictyocaulus viviparus]|uniref:SCP-like protein n=1 Tax=Dictyocaulus viviparus TaxID=29172 RepID=A0A0D8XJF8_DICVI|nr:SCP-like protein [Dictyocaulus viviparus]
MNHQWIIENANSSCYSGYHLDSDKIPRCGKKRNMNEELRKDILTKHNSARMYVATQERYPVYLDYNIYPSASNMSLLKYDCQLERAAFKISKKCERLTHPSFQSLGSNNATVKAPFQQKYLYQVVGKWWNTKRYHASINVTVVRDDRPSIPFLQMIHDKTTKIGCAFTTCYEGTPEAFVSFVCSYGPPYIKRGENVYEPGIPCSACPDRCIGGLLCNNTITRHRDENSAEVNVMGTLVNKYKK